jgi:hypothetical protein
VDPDVAAALDALKAATGRAPQQAVSSPLPNPLPEPGAAPKTGAGADNSTSPAAASGADAQIGD